MTTPMRDPELDLVIAACRSAYGGESAMGNMGTVRWNRLLEHTERHRVQALCWQGLSEVRQQVPAEAADQFAEQSRAIVEANLRAAAECARLQARFRDAGIELLFLKGLTLGALAYPDPMLKMGWDIDLLVAAHQITDAAGSLREAGYELLTPGRIERLPSWHSKRKESVWHSSRSGISIDLHSRLADHPAMLPEVGINSQRQLVPVARGIELQTLAKEELFAYLCVHGASSAWFRLKWIVDLAGLLHRVPTGEIIQLYDRSQQLGAGRAADQALILVNRLFGLSLGDELERRLENRRVGNWLASVAEGELSNPREPTQRFLGTAAIHYTQPFLLPGLGFKFSELARQARDTLAMQMA